MMGVQQHDVWAVVEPAVHHQLVDVRLADALLRIVDPRRQAVDGVRDRAGAVKPDVRCGTIEWPGRGQSTTSLRLRQWLLLEIDSCQKRSFLQLMARHPELLSILVPQILGKTPFGFGRFLVNSRKPDVRAKRGIK